MGEPPGRFRRLFSELKRRNVYRVGVTYAVVAFVVIQVADLVFPALNIPPWAYSFVVVLTLLGFPVALVLAWAFEMTAEGVRRTPELEPAGEGAEEGEAADEAAEAVPEDAPPPPMAERSKSRIAAEALVALGLLGGAVAGGWYLLGGDGVGYDLSEGTVAVLPFEVSGSGADTWRDGMVTLLSAGLDGAGGLRAIADRTVFAAWRRGGRPGEGTSTEEALAVARQVGAQYAVVGSAVQLGDELRFVAGVHETESGDRLARVEVKGSPDSVTALSDSLTRRVLGVLLEAGDDELPSVNLAGMTTESLPALKSFLAGERHLRAAEYEAAIEDYEAAVEADSTFALAYLRLGWAHGWSLDNEARRRSWKRAYELSDRLPERERGVARASYLWVRGRMGAAADSLRRLTGAYPDDPIVWYNLGEVLWHGHVTAGRPIPGGWPAADRAFARAIELDPGHAIYYPHHAQLGIAVRHDSALASERIASIPREDWRRAFRIPLELAFGAEATRRDALTRLDTLPLSFFRGLGPRFALWHPAELDAHETMLRRLSEREGGEELLGRPVEFDLAVSSFLQGQVREGLSRLKAGWVECVVAYVRSVGIPVPDTAVRAEVDPAALPADTSDTPPRCVALWLIQQGRGEEADRLIARLRERAEAPRGDPSLDEVEGYRAWRAGDLEEAARRLSGGIPGNTWVMGTGGVWLGDIHRELGELGKAEGWYHTAWTHPVAHERLGRLYEEMGEPGKAAAGYRRFVAAWEDADEELQPRVERARERLRELTGAEGEADPGTAGSSGIDG